MYPIKQSSAITIPIFVHDASGNAVTGLVDAGFTKRISKNGGAFAAMTVTITEMENGFYSVPVSTVHSDTNGVLTMVFTHASAKQVNIQFRVETKLNDDLNNIAATQIVSNGPITTNAGAVSNVTLVATTTTNTDMRGTDNAALASVATEARLSELDALTAGKMANQVDIIQVDTTTDIPAQIAALNNIAATQIVSNGPITTNAGAVSNVTLVATTTTNTDMRGTNNAATAAALAVAQSDLDIITGADGAAISSVSRTNLVSGVWSDTLTTYTDGMAGKRVKGITAVPALTGIVSDTSATTTSFVTNLTGYGNSFFNNALMIVEIAAEKWQAKPILTYTSATGVFTFDEAFISAPINGSNIVVQHTHIHPVSEIQNGLATAASIAALNDIAATDIVSSGPITTNAGAVSNVILVATTTTNTDMRGTNGANTVAPDNAGIAAIKALTDTVVVSAGKVVSDVQAVGGSTSGVAGFNRAITSNVVGTVATGSTNTVINCSALSPSGSTVDQFKGKVITFAADTLTVGLRSQSTVILSNTAAALPVFTVTALSATPVAGDTFVAT